MLLPPLTEEESYDHRCWRINYAKKILKQFENTDPAPRLKDILYQDCTRLNRQQFELTDVDVSQLKASHSTLKKDFKRRSVNYTSLADLLNENKESFKRWYQQDSLPMAPAGFGSERGYKRRLEEVEEELKIFQTK